MCPIIIGRNSFTECYAQTKKAPGTAGINPPSQTLNIVPIIIGRNSFTIVLYGALSERVYFIFKFS